VLLGLACTYLLQSTCQDCSGPVHIPQYQPKAQILLVLRGSTAEIGRGLDYLWQAACLKRLLTEVNDVVVRPRLPTVAAPPRFNTRNPQSRLFFRNVEKLCATHSYCAT